MVDLKIEKIGKKNTTCTLFSECLAHENHPNFRKSLGQRPQRQVINIVGWSGTQESRAVAAS